MIGGFVGHWEIHAPEGLTNTGRQQRFQQRTIDRLAALGNQYGGRTLTALKTGVAETYQEGEGVTERSIHYAFQRGQNGFSIEYLAGGRALVFLTAMAGLPFASPGHFIPQEGRSRFYWKHPLHGLRPGMYSFTSKRPAFWQTRQKRDVITETLNAGAQAFAEAMIAENNRAVVEFVQNDLRVNTRSPRVHVAAGSGVAPQ